MEEKGTCQYDDIIHLPNPTSAAHPRMPLHDRAAQFSPFAALTGYDAAIRETARLTDKEKELDEDVTARLDEEMRVIQERLKRGLPVDVTITYFEPDEKKSGGAYVSYVGNIKRVDEYERVVVMEDGVVIHMERIVSLCTMPCGEVHCNQF